MMKTIRSLGVCTAVVCTILPNYALSMDIPDALYPLLQQHPSVQELQYKSSAELMEAEAQLGLPDPEASIGINNLPITDPSFDTYLPTNKSIGIQQKIPSQTVRNARADKNREQSAFLELKTGFQIEQLYGLWMKAALTERNVRERLSVVAQQRDALSRYEDGLNTMAEAGNSMAFERISLLDVERADLDVRTSELHEMQAVAQARMTAIVGERFPLADALDQVPAIETIRDLPFWEEELAEAGRKIAEADVATKQAGYTPDFGIGVTYQQRDAGKTFKGDDWVSVKASIRIPFWTSQTHDNRLAAAKAMESAARAKTALAGRNAMEQWDRFVAERESALTTIARLDEKYRALDETLKARRNAYENGQGDVTAFEAIALKQLDIGERILSQQLKSDLALVSLHMLKRSLP